MIHDWTKVDAGIFHHFHLEWTATLAKALNSGLLPPDHYALAEQITGGWEPDVLTLRGPTRWQPPETPPASGMLLQSDPPRVQHRAKAESNQYAAKAKAIVIRHTSGHHIIAVVEIVSPGNKSSQQRLRAFVGKVEQLLRSGIHLLVIDLFPPGNRDPEGIHKAIWDEFTDNDFTLPPDKPLTLAAYVGGMAVEAFIEPTCVGLPLVKMPLFLSAERYIDAPLEESYESAWEAVPRYWRDVLEGQQNGDAG